MITEIIATVLFWVGATSVASALAYVPKTIRLYYVLIVMGNLLILLTSPLMYQWRFNIGILTLIMITAQIKNGLDAREENKRRVL
tara:strand:+ start:194 stop:448 length:255 start_codon:yes stop_codon:yes gene_type:complete